ncbi:MAG: hypothetical protein D6734_05655 [Candidatus Schekmanbacteria bacterium]|nr:MAG: hypothetical protein D6734_05655 [Candidatus Schekmanbacteria bacterium]
MKNRLKNRRLVNLSVIFLSIFMFLAFALNSYAGGKSGKFKIVVKIKTDYAIAVEKIPVYLSNNIESETIQGVTNRAGKAKFSSLSDGTYIITPKKDGFSFKPSSKEITLSGKKKGKCFFTIIKDANVSENMLNVPSTHYPTHLCQGADGNFYVTDSKANSVFVYNYKLDLVDRFGGMSTPLGIAVDKQGNVYVGNDGKDNIEIYNRVGKKISSIGDGEILMPNSIALDKSGNIYVADSLDDNIKVFDSAGNLIKKIGEGILDFPSDIVIKYNSSGKKGRLFAADQGNGKIRIFKLNGKLIKSIGKKVTNNSSNYKGKFVRLQGIDIDDKGRIHAVDSFTKIVQILSSKKKGKFIASYNVSEESDNAESLPLDILTYSKNKTIVANAERHSVNLITTAK